MRLRLLLTLCSAVFVSWLAAFSWECYYRGPPAGPSVHPRDRDPPYPGGTDDNIFWFLQISDIHLSLLNGLEVGKDLRSFCTQTVSTVSPSLVLVTGDLTHAMFSGEYMSKQFEEEWKAYRDILTETGVTERQPWLDIRGNHDDFNVESRSHDNNMYKRYSLGHAGHESYSYSYTHSTEFGSYRFIGVDACPSPGPKRPFNFFGVLHDEDLFTLRSLLATPDQMSPPNSTLWFSHYPSSIIVTDHRALRQLMSSSIAHVCGHLHTLKGVMHTMYGRHPTGHLELELVDFKDNRRYRLMAVDHDMFSFTDTTLGHWPLVLVTNPKDSRFSVPGKEPLGRMAGSTHVRILAFSPPGIKSVRVWLDGRPLRPTTRVVRGGPLYTTPWDPMEVATGIHTITVVAEDTEHRFHNSSHQFSLDGNVLPLTRLPQLLLLTDVKSLFQMFFLLLWLSILSVLTLSWVNRAQTVHFQPLVKRRAVFYPLMTLLVYLGIGPWCVGEIMTGVYGLIWVHGLQVSGYFIPGSLTYLFGSSQLLLWYIPLICFLNRLLSPQQRCTSLCPSPLLCHLTMLLLFLFHCSWLWTFSPYGTLAFLLSPGVSWTFH